MIGIVVTAHGELATALVAAAQSVLPSRAPIEAVPILEGDDSAAYESRLQAGMQKVLSPGGILVLTDMFGGTPSNIGLTLHRAGYVEILTGANLPMLIKAIQLAPEATDLAAFSLEVKDGGRRAITLASQLLGVKNEGEAIEAPR